MYLEDLAPSWQRFQRRLLAQARVLLVDDDESVLHLVGRLLEREGFTVDRVETHAAACEALAREAFDLALVDANLPDRSGLELIEQIRDNQLGVATVLVTGYASAEMIDRALAGGAADYLTKPFESTAHLVRRLRAVLDRRITTLLFDVMVNDLSKAVHAGGMESRVFADLSQNLLDFKIGLGKRIQCMIVDDDPERAEERRATLAQARLAPMVAGSAAEAVSALGDRQPLVAAVSLESSGALGLIRRLRDRDPHLEILALAGAVELDTALSAVEAGAADFALVTREGIRTGAVRVERLLTRARRHRLFLHLVGTLYQAARAVNPDLAEDLIYATTDADRAIIENTPSPDRA